ncbi:MAG: hypothetical protein M5T61_02860 [Acidimicrobiia bacterium]|nr:hypothetical protein [Acidimicrobiia bacterium]
MSDGVDPAPDPVAAKRARIAATVKVAKRAGYGALLLSIVAFAIAVATGFPPWLIGVAVVGLGAFCVIAPVPIILGYGLRAAAREERGGRGH